MAYTWESTHSLCGMSSSCSIENGRNMRNIPNITNVFLIEWRLTAEVEFEAEVIVGNVRKTRTPDRPMYTEHTLNHTHGIHALKTAATHMDALSFSFLSTETHRVAIGNEWSKASGNSIAFPYSRIIFFHVLGYVSSFVSESIYHDFRVEELRVTNFIPSKMDPFTRFFLSHDIHYFRPPIF